MILHETFKAYVVKPGTEWRLCSASKEVVRAEGKERGHLKQLQANNVVLKTAGAIG